MVTRNDTRRDRGGHDGFGERARQRDLTHHPGLTAEQVGVIRGFELTGMAFTVMECCGGDGLVEQGSEDPVHAAARNAIPPTSWAPQQAQYPSSLSVRQTGQVKTSAPTVTRAAGVGLGALDDRREGDFDPRVS